MASKLLLHKEYMSLRSKPKSNYFQVYGLKEDNIHEWIVFIIGPPSTFYEGGIYKALLRFPPTYPMDPPSLQFTCKFYHPNVYRDGKVCISTLQVPPPVTPEDPDYGSVNTATHWRPVIGVEAALLSVVSLLSDPNHDDPANPSAALEWQRQPDLFKQKIQKIAQASKTQVPSDFIMPIIATTSSTQPKKTSNDLKSHKGKRDGSNACKFSSNDDAEEEEEYVYSDNDSDSEDENQNKVEEVNGNENKNKIDGVKCIQAKRDSDKTQKLMTQTHAVKRKLENVTMDQSMPDNLKKLKKTAADTSTTTTAIENGLDTCN
mmetsp:Transcript_10952/g.13716  ORF Transcript_10952/g.13716 Transcript_10952/m.13716 type:complete len:318 (-) Transcript_10952:248-1201(-)|eukprot:CAMPEP_0204827714 /NCGR_PEP_ID=MMETSP1346-20131115/5166_1 /ASSEMBLY_ACC=CAM_ASM_000771 /TAXON_ID=215587 /ORGANISM="Aplanochytrium stocchinoi, Strain GSBS06" /LENGTH=317 /DNA_ID=CAMNT_0051956257 /DNA_START=376 /DNA_END=1332 /DNA_ORIENTATION=-